ncbi:MAG: hypothetical protein LBV34_02655 [Nocardiopsaceae bacterium]|jgi:hypothetical protein|nr:hypothetical protein [Nocardiopsaceae bacterium]
MRRRSWIALAAIMPLVASALAWAGQAAQASGTSAAAHAATGNGPGLGGGRTGMAAGDPFCKRLGVKYQASAAAQMFCFGAQKVSKVQPGASPSVAGAPRNVNAASFAEDVSPAGARGYGQSETSIAASGRYVVEAWNDSTTFFSACGNKRFKEEATGIGFSVNGGRTFKDLGGLRNPGCKARLYGGDPSVAAYRVGGHTFFYVASLYIPVSISGQTHIAFDVCEVMGSGSTARLHCSNPIVAASSSQCLRFAHGNGFCSFVDKEFLAIDPARGRLYVSYSDFPVVGAGGNPEDMSVCDIGTRAGRAGPAGGTPARPVCKHGTPLVKTSRARGHLFVGKPYFRVAHASLKGCENEGAYPAVNLATGSVYVAYEFNVDTNLFNLSCVTVRTKTKNFMTKTPFGCLKLRAVSPCAGPTRRKGVAIVSMDTAFIPGYTRFPMNDFPRLAVSSRHGTVSMVWNDARKHPNGDIMMQSFRLGTLARVQRAPTVLDRPHGGGFTMLPALRVANRNGLLDVAWYSRASTGTALTSVKAATGVNPATRRTPRNITITNRATNWIINNSDINPNFGDYTDAVVSVTGRPPFVGRTLYIAWSDGRSGVPQPFEAHIPAG